MLALVSATLWGIPCDSAKAQKEVKTARSERGKTSIATANWFGDTPGEDFTTTAICVKNDGSYVCLIPSASPEKSNLTLTIDGIERESEILATDTTSGICLAKATITEATEPLPLSTGAELNPGCKIVPLQNESTARLAGIDREYLGETLPISMLRVHLSEKRSACAGQPVFCPSGEVAGLLTNRKLTNPREAHAIPAARISKLLADYENQKQTGRIWIGASFHRQSTTPEVVTITPNSPAEKAGLKPGDIIIKVGGTPITSLPELAAICENMPGGQPIIFEILRELKIVEYELVPEITAASSTDSEKK